MAYPSIGVARRCLSPLRFDILRGGSPCATYALLPPDASSSIFGMLDTATTAFSPTLDIDPDLKDQCLSLFSALAQRAQSSGTTDFVLRRIYRTPTEVRFFYHTNAASEPDAVGEDEEISPTEFAHFTRLVKNTGHFSKLSEDFRRSCTTLIPTDRPVRPARQFTLQLESADRAETLSLFPPPSVEESVDEYSDEENAALMWTVRAVFEDLIRTSPLALTHELKPISISCTPQSLIFGFKVQPRRIFPGEPDNCALRCSSFEGTECSDLRRVRWVMNHMPSTVNTASEAVIGEFQAKQLPNNPTQAAVVHTARVLLFRLPTAREEVQNGDDAGRDSHSESLFRRRRSDHPDTVIQGSKTKTNLNVTLSSVEYKKGTQEGRLQLNLTARPQNRSSPSDLRVMSSTLDQLGLLICKMDLDGRWLSQGYTRAIKGCPPDAITSKTISMAVPTIRTLSDMPNLIRSTQWLAENQMPGNISGINPIVLGDEGPTSLSEVGSADEMEEPDVPPSDGEMADAPLVLQEDYGADEMDADAFASLVDEEFGW
ncbi:uncharacterized protein MKK02DRAFT_32854 [Dioszegia hungarica]|uniref:Uncharacterized protein n=1 Tax=Dioszegia hungarica TaxID=4972 RepID=A0AA38LV82_9TREE|nr:uncharacterized protein MKK02DRAFT_32854 [Dioszegia hungarica]KAI9635429.1 hypothetical protein MKK02DRAFT_32854 [Dioszegia hungarica]